jgi:hypothetical protein
MTDRELLELAAKAIGIDGLPFLDNQYCQGALRCGYWDDLNESCWNPLTDDGDAFRLAVKLNMELVVPGSGKDVYAGRLLLDAFEPVNGDPYAATRRAIVRAAAQIGKEKNQ